MSKRPTLVFSDESYDGQLERTLYKAPGLSADLGEAMATARSIGKADADRWFDGWSSRAEEVQRRAEQLRGPSRCIAYLRASEYYRQAFFFLRHDLADPRLQQAYGKHVECFEAARPLLDTSVEPCRVQAQDGELKGYFYRSGAAGETRPTVLLPCGYDSTAEESHVFAMAAVRQGFSALTFEGPGQGAALILHRSYFRPEFEQTLTPWLDLVLARDDVDPAKVVLIGRSFAGYLAPRAAAFEHRLAALVCDPAQPNVAAHLPEGVVGKLAVPVSELQMRLDPKRAEFFGSRMAAHGLDSVEAYFEEIRRYNMLDVAGQITCSTLAVECEGDFAGGGGPSLVAAMSAPATLLELSADEGAGGHCAGLGQLIWEERVYAWIRQVLDLRSESLPASGPPA
jgi:hypothetical protein